MKLRERLTDRNARTLQLPADMPHGDIFFDGEMPSYGLRVRPGGSRVWVVKYKFAGKKPIITLGSIDTMTAAAARDAAKDILAKVRLGVDPAAERRQARVEAVETFGAVLPKFLAHKRTELKERSYEEIERHLVQHLRPLHPRPLAGLELREISLLLTDIAATSGPNAANAVRTSGSGYLNWAMRAGIATANPFAYANKAGVKPPRARTPTAAELREIWKALPDSDYGRIVKLLILLGLRKTEIGDLRWSEVDLDVRVITLPASRTKGGREFEIPLSGPALAILKAVPRRDGREHVFGRNGGGFSGWSKAKRELDARIAAARLVAAKKGKPEPMVPWVLHDTRRSFSSTAHETLGIAPHIVEECLGHATYRAGVAGIYNRSAYRNEKRQALEQWGAHVIAIVESRKNVVVSLARA